MRPLRRRMLKVLLCPISKPMGESERDPILKDFVAHLEFLGYEIVPQEEEKDGVLAKHQTNGTSFVKPYLGGVLLQQYFRINDKAQKKRSEFLEAVNQLNSTSHLTTYVGGRDDNLFLRMDGYFLGGYDKKKFGVFLEAYMTDTFGRVVRNEAMKNFID